MKPKPETLNAPVGMRGVNQKRYRLMRVSKEFVWVRWDAYGSERRGLSIKIPISEFRRDWVRLQNRIVEKRSGGLAAAQ